MSNLFTSSIGRKLMMSITGAFLVLFLLFHVSMNIVAVFSAEGYNMICKFLGANWYALAGTLVIAAGVVFHIGYAVYLTWMNRKARGEQRYDKTTASKGVSWSSQNMFVLGLVVLGGLLMHLYNFWYKMQFTEIMGHHVNSRGLSPQDGAGMLLDQFSNPFLAGAYILWLVALWLHLTHGLWSMFQSVGLSNKVWFGRLKLVANIAATVIILGFALVVVVFALRGMGICSTCI